MDRIREFLERVGIKYKDIKKYEEPFLHSSYIHETPWDDVSYDRLEFFGDSILGFYTTEHLFNTFPNYSEGEMTLIKHHVVNKEALSKIGRELEIEKLMFLGQGEDRNNLSDSIFEDVIESLIGAIYLDAGDKEARKFVKDYILKDVEKLTLDDAKDPKSKLQELIQADNRKSVSYETDNGIRQEDGKLLFTSKAIFETTTIGEGQGLSKKEAEKVAAKDAIDRMA